LLRFSRHRKLPSRIRKGHPMKLMPLNRRAIYLADAAGSLALAVGMAAFAVPLEAAAGSAMPAGIILVVGLGLLPWAGFNAWIGLRGTYPTGAARVNVAGDALWVIASLALLVLAGPGLTSMGAAIVGMLAAAVAIIGAVKATGLRRAPAAA
jgi:hypothetical protein